MGPAMLFEHTKQKTQAVSHEGPYEHSSQYHDPACPSELAIWFQIQMESALLFFQQVASLVVRTASHYAELAMITTDAATSPRQLWRHACHWRSASTSKERKMKKCSRSRCTLA